MKRNVIFVSLVLLLAAVIAGVYFAFINSSAAKDYWPDGGWRTCSPEQQGMDSQLLADMIDSIRLSGMNVNSVTIIRNGYLVSEVYFYPYQKGYKHAAYSCAKSFTSALMGAAIADGAVKSADDNVLDYFSDLDIKNADSRKHDMTIRDVLSMTSGLDWKFENDVSSNEMLQSADWTKYTLDLPMSGEPGETFDYSDGAAHVASALIQRATRKTACDYLRERFEALGISDFYWSTNPEGVTNGASGLFLQPGDMAKLGYLYLKKGNWNGKQLVPERWVEESTKAYTQPGWTPYLTGYGYFWWVTDFGGFEGFAAVGNGGNFIFVVPELEIVAVFTSGIYDNSVIFYPCELMDKYIIPAVKHDDALTENGEASLALKSATDRAQAAPEPKAVSLPVIALEISEKTYDINGTPVSFHFTECGDEFALDLNSVTYTGGLDGVYRVYDSGSDGSLPDHNHEAVRGEWLSGDTLKIEIRGLEDAYINIYTVRFEGDSITVTIDSNYWPGQTVTGSISG